ncbi:MAG: UDP-N-acetylmuramoyl-tripeptide--D-alanyl-D-alanine ligase [Pseudomonadota bacterium]
MSLWTGYEIAEATGGYATRDFEVTQVSIDSREISKGALFIALKDRRDGHEFVASALKAGAAGALVSEIPPDVPKDAPLVVVSDTFQALRALGHAGRMRTKAKVIGVTGSVGKTGTKEMLRQMLAGQGRVHAAYKSFNNHWGVPLTLARMPRETEFAVIEIGMNAPGEIAPLADLAQLDVAMITTVAPVHIENFENIEGIAHEKASILSGLKAGGVAVLPCDVGTYPILEARAERGGFKAITFGESEAAAYRLQSVRVASGATLVDAQLSDRPILFRIGAPGRHLATNALGALAAVAAAGADPTKAALALGQWEAPEGRGARWRIDLGEGAIDGAILLIDDAYNANPTSLAASLETFVDVEPQHGIGRVSKGRRVAFLTDMLELGKHGYAMHAEIATLPTLAKIDRVHCAGPLMKALYDALPPQKRGHWFAEAEGLAKRAPKLVDAGDVALVKGSKGSRAARVVEALKDIGQAVRADDFADGET